MVDVIEWVNRIAYTKFISLKLLNSKDNKSWQMTLSLKKRPMSLTSWGCRSCPGLGSRLLPTLPGTACCAPPPTPRRGNCRSQNYCPHCDQDPAETKKLDWDFIVGPQGERGTTYNWVFELIGTCWGIGQGLGDFETKSLGQGLRIVNFAKLRFERLSWVHTEASVKWANFYKTQ